jgi:DNA polymerase III alpha subunit
MKLFARDLKGIRMGKKMIKAEKLGEFVGRKVSLAGWLLTGKLVSTRKGEPMQFLTFEDETAIFETTFFPQVHRRFCHMLDRGRPYILSGLVEEDFGAITLTVDGVRTVGKVVSSKREEGVVTRRRAV